MHHLLTLLLPSKDLQSPAYLPTEEVIVQIQVDLQVLKEMPSLISIHIK